MHDALFKGGSLLRALDALSDTTGASVRLGIRNFIHAQCVHVSWPGGTLDRMRLRPCMLMPSCHDALGMMLLAQAGDVEVKAIVRHANAICGSGGVVNPEDYLDQLDRCRRFGCAEADCFACAGERVLSVALPTPFGVPAAIGLGLPANRLENRRAALLHALHGIVKDAWTE